MSHVVAEREYWERQLSGRDYVCASFPALPPDKLPASGEPARFDFVLRPETARRLLALGHGSDPALFTLLLAGVRQLLFRYTGHPRIALGAPVFSSAFDPAQRNSLLVLAAEVDRHQSFKDALRLEREIVLGAQAHQDFPVVRALAALGVTYSADCFGVMVALTNVQTPACIHAERPAVAFVFERAADVIRGAVSYDAARYRPDYVVQIGAHLDALLLARCSTPAAPLAAVELLSPAERERLLSTYARRAAPPTAPSTIVDAFEAQVAHQPERIALKCDGVAFTYAELNRRANRLARELQSLHLRPEEAVALYLPRSAEAVIGMLGILKAGGLYLPLDPSYPPARNRFMIEDAAARLVLTVGDPPDREALGPVTWVNLDAAPAGADGPAAANLADRPAPDHLAYVIYTSGSTGRPKGVPIPHRGVIQLVRGANFARLTPDAVVLLQTSLTFDLSVYEIWGTLLSGAQLVVLPKFRPTIDDLADVIRREKINFFALTPALFNLAVDELPSALLPVSQLLVGGEAMSVRHARDFLRAFTGRLSNVYGPTENSVISIAHVVTAADLVHPSVPIGRPTGETEVYILDDALRPVPVGVTGEIYLGGGGLARGYLHRPALTAERFLPHPFSAIPGARLYRSGDLGRFLADGVIECGGRIDGQVKLRGFRIELGEIESLLCEHPAIKAAAAVVQEEPNGAKRLVAFAVARDGHMPAGRELQDFLLQRTPAHQIPAAFFFRADLPLNRSGKIDRRSLLGLIAPPAPVVREPPRTPAEHTMVAIWQQVLGREPIGVGEDFFEIGGDSLLAMQVLARINKSGLRLAAKQFFREPTIAACALAARPVGLPSSHDAPPLQGSVSLTPVQRWFFATHAADPNYFNMSALFDVKQAIDPAIIARAAGHLLRHHDAFQLVFARAADTWTAHYAPLLSEDRWFTTVDLSALADGAQTPEVEARAQAFQASLDVTVGPLIRFVYFQCGGGGRDRLLIAVHHLVIDAVSWRIVLDDLETVLGQLVAGREVQLPPPTDRFGTWANQLPLYLQSPAAAAGRAYWLATSPVPADFPAASPAGSAAAPRPGESVRYTLTMEETRDLRRLAPDAKATMEELLLAALLLALGGESAESHFAVTLDRHGRAESIGPLDVSRTVGWFTAFFPVYLTLGRDRSFAAVLAVVRAMLRRIPNRGVDFEILRHLGEPEERRRLTAYPPPGVSLNYQGEFDQVLAASSFFNLSADAFGAQQSVRHQRFHGLDLDAAIFEDKLTLAAAWDPRRRGREPTARLVAQIAATLRTLPRHFRPGPADVVPEARRPHPPAVPAQPQPVT